MSSDYEQSWQDPTTKVWIEHVLNDMAPKMQDSAVVLSICPPQHEDGTLSTGDVKYWVELGASICMDKPILVVVLGDRQVPHKLQMVADEVVRLRDGVNPAASDELAQAIKRMCGD